MSMSRHQLESSQARNTNEGTVTVGRASHCLMPNTRASLDDNVNVGTNVSAQIQNLFQNPQLGATFRVLRRHVESLYDNFADEIKAAFDLPKLWEDFKSLDWKMQILVVLCVISIVGLAGWMTWELACFLYPKIVAFLNSEEGKATINNIGNLLEGLKILATQFGGIVCGAANGAAQQVAASPRMPLNQVQADDNLLTQTAQTLQMTASSSTQSNPEAQRALAQFIEEFLRWYTISMANS